MNGRKTENSSAPKSRSLIFASTAIVQYSFNVQTTIIQSFKMRSTTVIALFAGSVAAQSSAVVVNPIMPAATLTVVGSSEGTTTYVNSCSDAGIPASYLPSGMVSPCLTCRELY